jgi:hypothetical protein
LEHVARFASVHGACVTSEEAGLHGIPDRRRMELALDARRKVNALESGELTPDGLHRRQPHWMLSSFGAILGGRRCLGLDAHMGMTLDALAAVVGLQLCGACCTVNLLGRRPDDRVASTMYSAWVQVWSVLANLSRGVFRPADQPLPCGPVHARRLHLRLHWV